MYVQMTYAALGLLTCAMLVLRFFWWRLPRRLQTVLLWLGGGSSILPALSLVTKWSVTSNRTNTLLNWIAIAGYQMLLVRFSLIRPQWLTSFCAVVLLLPIFASSLLYPLTDLFHPREYTTVFAMQGPYLGERSVSEPSGDEDPEFHIFDIKVYYRPRFAPFLKHRLQRSAFNTTECDAAHATAAVLYDSGDALFHCPAKPGKPALDRVLPLNQPGTPREVLPSK